VKTQHCTDAVGSAFDGEATPFCPLEKNDPHGSRLRHREVGARDGSIIGIGTQSSGADYQFKAFSGTIDKAAT
jgi:hypothetical protein